MGVYWYGTKYKGNDMKKIIENISIFGDSISKGVILDEISKKYKMLKESAADLFSRENNVTVKNHAKFGCTSDKILKIAPDLLNGGDGSEIVLLGVGGNDCDFNWDNVANNPDLDHVPNVPIERFRENIVKIIEMIKAAGKRTAIVTQPPIDSDKYFSWISHDDTARGASIMRFLGDKNYIYRHHELYASALEEAALQNGIFRIPVRAGFLATPKYSDYLCADGIHLNSRGQQAMESIFTDTYKRYLDEN